MAVAVYAPSFRDFPNEVLTAKVIRVDVRKRTADVRVSLGGTSEDVNALPLSAIFHWDALETAIKR